jgi:8-amino-3,8-dideoxy-alpha-D-manno-octulosonate transaminase
MLQDKEQRIRVNQVLKEHGAEAICFAENTWHYFPKWEHLLAGLSLTKGGWPFIDQGNKKRVVFDPQSLPESTALLERTLMYPISIKMSEDKMQSIENALKKAALV